MKAASFLQCFVLTFGCALSVVYADCPPWDDLLSEESVTQVNISSRRYMFVAYINPPQLGVCLLGETLYNQVREDLLENEPNRHLFWIGVDGTSLDLLSMAGRIYMLQGDQEFYVVSAGELGGDSSRSINQSEILISLEGEIDFSEPVTIFYRRGRRTYSNEYWLPEKYLAK